MRFADFVVGAALIAVLLGLPPSAGADARADSRPRQRPRLGQREFDGQERQRSSRQL